MIKRLDPMVGDEPMPVEDPEAEQERAEADFWKAFPQGLEGASAQGPSLPAKVPPIEEDADG